MFARVGMFQGPPEHLEAALRRSREQTLPDLERLPGFRGVYVLVDRQTGKGVGISLWETEAALQGSEDIARRHREPQVGPSESLPSARWSSVPRHIPCPQRSPRALPTERSGGSPHAESADPL